MDTRLNFTGNTFSTLICRRAVDGFLLRYPAGIRPFSSQPPTVGRSIAHPHPHIPEGSTLYDFSVKDANGNVVSLEKFRTIPTVLIVKMSVECLHFRCCFADSCSHLNDFLHVVKMRVLVSSIDSCKHYMTGTRTMVSLYWCVSCRCGLFLRQTLTIGRVTFNFQAFPTADALSSELHDADSLEKHGESRKVNFPLFGRVTPSGHNEHPLFQWLHVGVSATSYPTDAEMEFTRFLVVSGQPWKRYTAEDSMNKIEADVAHALHKMNDANSAHGVNVKLHDCSSQTG